MLKIHCEILTFIITKKGVTLRKFAVAILFAFLLITGTGTAPAQAGVVTFTFRNLTAHTVFMKMYSASRVWPGANRHFILDDDAWHSARLACVVGEKICFGGSWRTDDTPKYWGIGYTGSHGCTDCCLICGTDGQNLGHAWNLTE
jgi:hypothetical protein